MILGNLLKIPFSSRGHGGEAYETLVFGLQKPLIEYRDSIHDMARQTWLSFLIGGAFVAALQLLGQRQLATPVPFLLLLPGLLAGTAIPGSGFELKEDHPLSPLATLVVYAVNVTLYGCLAHLLLHRVRSIIVSRKRRTA